MEDDENFGLEWIMMFIVTAAFLAVLVILSARDLRREEDGYIIRTERTVSAAEREEESPDPEEDAVRSGPIDINSATAEELEELIGIGPALAQAIVDYREEHGPFQSVDELLEVSGIGEKKLAGIRDDVTLGEEESP